MFVLFVCYSADGQHSIQVSLTRLVTFVDFFVSRSIVVTCNNLSISKNMISECLEGT